MIIKADQAGINAITAMMTKGMKNGAFDPGDLEGLTMIKHCMELVGPETDKDTDSETED